MTNNFHRAGKERYPLAKFYAFGRKWRKIWKIARKFSDFLIKMSMENWHFIIFTKYFLDFRLRSESIYTPLEDTTSFLQQFFRFRGGGRSGVPRPLPTILIWVVFSLQLRMVGMKFSIISMSSIWQPAEIR